MYYMDRALWGRGILSIRTKVQSWLINRTTISFPLRTCNKKVSIVDLNECTPRKGWMASLVQCNSPLQYHLPWRQSMYHTSWRTSGPLKSLYHLEIAFWDGKKPGIQYIKIKILSQLLIQTWSTMKSYNASKDKTINRTSNPMHTQQSSASRAKWYWSMSKKHRKYNILSLWWNKPIDSICCMQTIKLSSKCLLAQ